jgi:molybdopterin-guanine dinucleotide biosynthesis adapter protein
MKKPIVIGFYGYSNSGKTTLIERLIRVLIGKSMKVAAIKQSGHPVSMDSDGKDTYRYTKAGADPVVLSTSIETTIKFNNSLEICEIIEMLRKYSEPDVILVESARDAEIRKIRIGDIKLRENTFWTYNGNFEDLLEKILNGGK